MKLLALIGRHRGTLAVLGVIASVCAMILHRLSLQPMPRYGGGAAQYIEHGYRVEQVVLYRSRTWDHWMEFLVAADIPEGFPPMAHTLSMIVGSVVGHSIEDLRWMGPFWLAVLALSIGWIALSLTRRRDIAAAALVGGFLLPAGHGFAMRFYYDLPAASILWLGLAIFVAGQERRPVLSGIVAGALVWVAGCVKWSMLPYAALMFPFAVLCRGVGERRLGRRILALAVAGAVAGLILWAWMDGGGGSHNETLASRSSSTGEWEQRVDWLPRVFQGVAARGIWELLHPDLGRVLWYPIALVVSILSPLWSLALAPLVWVALRRRVTGWLLPVGCVLGIGFFLTFALAVRDERFAIAGAAAIVLLAALGWGELGRRPRLIFGWVAVVAGLLVALDFHFAPPAPWNHPIEVYSGRPETPDDAGLPPLIARGLGLADSVEQRGWSRWDTTPPSDQEYLEDVWASIEACGGPALALSAHVTPNGSIPWLQYRAVLSYLEGGAWRWPEIDVQWQMPEDHAAEEPPPSDEPPEFHPPTGDTPPPEPPPAIAHVGLADEEGRGLPGPGWTRVSLHLHPEMAEIEEGPRLAVFARPPAACLGD